MSACSFCCVDGHSQTSRDVTRRHMRERHGDSLATMASVSAAGYLIYCTENPTNDEICFPKLLPMKNGVTLEEVLISFDLGSWNLIYFHRAKELGHYQKNVESDEAFYDCVSGCDARKLPSDSASRYSKIKTHMLAKQANKEKSTGLAKQNFGPGNSKRNKISAPASKSVNRRNSKDTMIKKGRLQLTLDQNKKVVGIQSSTTSRASSTGHSSRVGTPRAGSGSTGGARALFLMLSELLLVAPVPVKRLRQLKGNESLSRVSTMRC